MSNLKKIFFDTETTGLEVEDRIFELAFSYKDRKKSNYGNNFFYPIERYSHSSKFNPGLDISVEAAMTTNVMNNQVKGLAPFKDTDIQTTFKKLSEDKNYTFIAYNAPFDINMIEKEDISIDHKQVIDLYRVAKHLFKNETILDRNGEKKPLGSNKLQYFRYLFEFDEQPDFKILLKEYGLEEIKAHEALSDVIILEYFYHFIKKKFNLSIEEIKEFSQKPVLEPYISFGNVFEKGTSFETCFTSTYEQYGKTKNGFDYLDWCSNNLTLSVDTEFSVKMHFYFNIVQGNVPFLNKFERYLNYGIVFDTNEENIKTALKILKKDENYIEVLKSSFKSSMDKKYQENKNGELGDKFPYLFLSRYIDFLKN
ncbi:3'-5' exonuclease [bacterium]|jgi:DNA polymerase III epsilon subunit-like protein|nr:3'-5' exonuclease [bacterium]